MTQALLRQAWRHFRQGKVPYLFGLSTITMGFFLFALFLMVVENVEGLLKAWHKKVQVVCYLRPGLREGEIDRIRAKVARQEGVAQVKYIPSKAMKEELLRDMQEAIRGLESLQAELFPPCLELTLKGPLSPKALEALAQSLKGIKGVEEVQYGGEWLRRAGLLIRLLKTGMWIMGAVLSVVTLLITANTLKLVFYQRREEVEILRLVGATQGFIRGPFYLEGAVQGVTGAGMAVLLSVAVYASVGTELTARAYPYIPEFAFLSVKSIALLLVLGLVSGLLGGLISCFGSG